MPIDRLTLQFSIGAAFGLLIACGGAPDAYRAAEARAVRAYAHGRYDVAAEHWARAAASDASLRDRNEAAYRHAVSLLRAQRIGEAKTALQRILTRTPNSFRAPRAAYDLARIEMRHGDRAKAIELTRRALVRFPNSGPARGALFTLIAEARKDGDEKQVESTLRDLIDRVPKAAIREQLSYQLGRTFAAQGRLADAERQFLRVAKQFPYPHGALWDDALWRAAEAAEKTGRPRAAISHLKQMLKEQEPSHLSGSYQRPRFAEAQYHIGELYRDRLKDAAGARSAFRRVWTNHPNTLLRDDAKWAEARLAHATGDRDGACAAGKELINELPDSRYAACVHVLCPNVRFTRGRECRGYILREIRDAQSSSTSTSSE